MTSANESAKHSLDFSDLDADQIDNVVRAISRGDGERITECLPGNGLAFVLRNFKQLVMLRVLERNWMSAYVHASHLNDVPLVLLQEIFDTCDRRVLQQHYPIPELYHLPGHWALPHRQGGRLTLFRGCAGPEHRMGMSWIASLDKAIWYAAKHAAYYGLKDVAVYATTVHRDEIYCCADHYDFDFIVHPKTWWRIQVPESEFRLDRERW